MVLGRVLGHDVDIYCRGISQKAMDRGDVKITTPAGRGRTPEDNMGNALFMNYFGNGFSVRPRLKFGIPKSPAWLPQVPATPFTVPKPLVLML